MIKLDMVAKTAASGCGTSAAPSHAERKMKSVPFAERRLNLDAGPGRGTPVNVIDLDVTVECNLRCTYCFKEKWNEHMEEQVAFDAIVWLIHASGTQKDLHVSLMGGEPLIRFKMIQKLVPFAKRRAEQHGKRIGFGVTTNGTLVTDEVIAFWNKWGIGFHTSIDGTPEVQDINRPTVGGQKSSHLVERSARKILAHRPSTMARSTVTPSTTHTILDSYRYFRDLGYTGIGFVPGGMPAWDEATLSIYETQFRAVAAAVMDDLRDGTPVVVKGLDDYANSVGLGSRPAQACGAGRGTVLVDIHGDIWPCHRWNKQDEQEWRIGSIYQHFDDDIRAPLDTDSFTARLKNECHRCPARLTCGGGCPAENLEDTGSIYRRHPNACEITRIWHRVGKEVYDTMVAEQNTTYLDTYCSA